ncbi:MAG TPA: isochorismatase family cysteine hydrolase [Ktedonobacteraceae bacterium]|nr:isochorismatase family cysteine hydrolase [Ktedonobacteraceae bacterium]
MAVGFRPGYPEVSPRNKSFSAIKQLQSSPPVPMASMEIHPDIAPQPTDIVVTKRRVSAFSGSDLEVLLRAQDISHLVLSGIATSGVVLSTLREAADKDYQLTVLADCCVDGDEEVHRVLLSKVFSRQAEVLQASEWMENLKHGE